MQSKRLYSPNNNDHEQDKNSFLFESFLHDYDLESFHGLSFTQEEYTQGINTTLASQSSKKREEKCLQPHETTSNLQSPLYFDSMIVPPTPFYDIESGQGDDWRSHSSSSILVSGSEWLPFEQPSSIEANLLRSTGKDLFRHSPDTERDKDESNMNASSESDPSWDSLETKTTPEKQQRSAYESRQDRMEQTSSCVASCQLYHAFHSGRQDEKRPRHQSILPQRAALRPSPLMINSTNSTSAAVQTPDKLVEQGLVHLPSSRDYSFQPWVVSPATHRNKAHSLSSPLRISPTTLPSVTPRDETDMLLPNESLEGYCPCCGNVMENFQHDQRLQRLETEYQSLFCKVSKLQNSLLSLLKKSSLPSDAAPIHPE